MGHPRHPGEHRVPRRPRLQHARARAGARSVGAGRAPARARRRTAVVRDASSRSASGRCASTVTPMRDVDGAQIDGGSRPERRRRAYRSSSRSTSGRRAAVDERARCSRSAERILETPGGGRPHGRPRGSSSCSAATGTLVVGDEQFTNRRQRAPHPSRRASADSRAFRGHCWQSAIFPSGEGFGYITYPPRTDGKATFNEGYVFFGDGELIPARVVDPPWLRLMRPTARTSRSCSRRRRGDPRIRAQPTSRPSW